jgi:hypothetical protein
MTKNRNFCKWPRLLYFKPESAQNLNCISIMLSFLTYITGFFMNFELLPILNDYAKISIFSHGGHLGYRTALTDTILKGDHPRIISAKFG